MATKKKTNKTESDWTLSSGTAKDIEASESAPYSQVEIFDDVQTEITQAADALHEAAQTEVVLKETVLEGETVYDSDLAEVVEDFGYPEEVTVSVDGTVQAIGGEVSGVIRVGMDVSAKYPYAPAFIYNRLASLEGYRGFGVSYRKDWEIEMALKTLHDLGGAHPNANILGVGAGTERTIFELANDQSAALVTASDIYDNAGPWDGWHGRKFLQNPHKFAPAGLPYDPARVAAMHVDMCDMPYEDEVYDAIFSSGSIEHVGDPKREDWEPVMKAAREIGRVLKPGGIASISTEFKVSGQGWGFSGVRLFTANDLLKYIVEPSGLELVGESDWNFYDNFGDAVGQPDVVLGKASEENRPLLRYGDFLFTSVHLALVKPNKG
jgi:SAM-dependent methyltransferase